jgi:hypothetical protein
MQFRPSIFSIMDETTQVDHYDDRKRAVNDPFGRDSITAVWRRVVYGDLLTSFTVISVP